MAKSRKTKSSKTKTVEVKDLNAANAPQDPKGGLNFTNQALLPAVKPASITDGTSNTIMISEAPVK